MAVEVEGTNQVEEFLGILRRRAWWIAIPTVVLGAFGIAVAVIVPKKFVATAQVLVRDVAGLVQQSSAGAVSRMEGFVAPHVIRSNERASQVLLDLNWPDYDLKLPEERREYRKKLLESLDIDLYAVQNNAGAQIVRARFSHTSPQRAFEFLNAIVTSWKLEVQGRFERSEQKRLETLRSTETQFENQRTEVSNKLQEKRRQYNIRPDVVLQGSEKSTLLASSEFGQLDRVKELIEADEDELKDLETRILRLRTQLDAARPTIPRAPDAEDVGGVADDIRAYTRRKQELLLAMATNGWTVISSQYRKAQNEINEIDKKLDELRAVGTSGVTTSEVEDVNPERVRLLREIEEAEADQKRLTERRDRNNERREELEDKTDELYIQHQEINHLQAQFDNLTEQIKTVGEARAIQESQVGAISSDAGKFFEDLEAPSLPLRPTTPNPYVIAGLFQLVGVVLGLGLAVLTELSRSTFRNARDLSRVMVVPVLGTVNRIVTRRQRSRLLFAHVALATATLALVSVVGYVTWAWVYDPNALSEPLLNAIRGLREPFL